MRDINVLEINSITGKVSFSLGHAEKLVQARKSLLQLVVLSLLNDKGSNLYDTDKGSSISSLLGSSYNENEIDVVKTLLTLAVEETEQQIIQQQRNIIFNTDELDQKLKSMEIFSVEHNANTASWDIKILVRTVANNIGIIGL